MPKPNPNEQKTDYLQRCMSDEEMNNKYPDSSQRYAICNSYWEEDKMSGFSNYINSFAGRKISFDYDGVLSTDKGTELAKSLNDTLYIISARREKDGMINKGNELGIPEERIYAIGSNKAKIDKILELGIDLHYDNNPDVVKELGKHGKLF